MGPDEIHLRVLRELVEVIAKLFSLIYEQSWSTEEVPDSGRLAKMLPIYKKGQKEDQRNYSPVSLTSVLGKVMEQNLVSVITCHVQDNQVIRPSQHGLMKHGCRLTSLISFYDQVTSMLEEDIIYLRP